MVSPGVRVRAEQACAAAWRRGLGLPDVRSGGQRPSGRTASCSCRTCRARGARPATRSRSAFVGLNGFATRGDLLRAVIEGLDYQFVDMLTALRDDLSVPFDRLVVVGGAVKKTSSGCRTRPTWLGALCGKGVEAPEIDEATPLGAAMLAGIGVGLYRDHEGAYQHVYRPGARYGSRWCGGARVRGNSSPSTSNSTGR